jgi:hypothetical protein
MTISGTDQGVTFSGAVNVSSSAFANGSASAPSITFTGDTNTGIFSPAADTIAFAEGGTESMRIDSSGNVGIGTSSPTDRLDVNGVARFREELHFNPSGTVQSRIGVGTYTGSSAILAIGNDSGATANTIAFFNTGSERMRIDSSGRVTTPFQPAFICRANPGAQTYTTGQKVGFNNTPDLNVGSSYSAADSRFTAPVAGLYMFKAQVWSFDANPSAAWFSVNGTAKYGSYGNEATQIGFNGYAMVELFYLNANDYVEVYCRFSTVYTDSGFSTFSGFLVG